MTRPTLKTMLNQALGHVLRAFLALVVLGLVFLAGTQQGRKQAFSDISLEKCWLNKESRDIECITYID